jgi:hypothetical protein
MLVECLHMASQMLDVDTSQQFQTWTAVLNALLSILDLCLLRNVHPLDKFLSVWPDRRFMKHLSVPPLGYRLDGTLAGQRRHLFLAVWTKKLATPVSPPGGRQLRTVQSALALTNRLSVLGEPEAGMQSYLRGTR